MAKTKDLTNADALQLLAERIRTQATAPNVFAYEPHAKQKVFHESEAKKKLYIGGNRSGKTTGGIVEDIWWLTGTHPYRKTPPTPVRGRIVSVDFVNGIEKIILPQIKQWLPASFLINGSWEDSYDKMLRTLTLANGSFIEFMSYDQDLDKFAGTSRHFIHFDEEPPQDIFTECLARLVDTGGSYWVTMTPVEGMTWVYDVLYEPGKSGTLEDRNKILVVEVSMTDNPYLNVEAIEDFLSSLDTDERKAREHGQFVQLGGLIYKHFDLSLHVRPAGWIPPQDWLLAASMDHGYNNPTAWLWHGVSPDGEVVTFREHYVSGQTIDYHAAAVHRINKEIGRIPDYYIGDPSIRNTDAITGTSIHLEYIKFGIAITLANNDVKAGINRVSRYLKLRPNGKPNWVMTEDCVHLIREMRRYRWGTYQSKKIAGQHNLKDEPHKKDDHACDSARYFFMSRPDLVADQPTVRDPHNAVGAVSVTTRELRAEPFASVRAAGDYHEESNSTEWTYDEMGGMW